MVRAEHEEQIERWAEYVKNSEGKWKAEHTAFIDSQIAMANRFFKKLAETEEGRVKIQELKLIRARKN